MIHQLIEFLRAANLSCQFFFSIKKLNLIRLDYQFGWKPVNWRTQLLNLYLTWAG